MIVVKESLEVYKGEEGDETEDSARYRTRRQGERAEQQLQRKRKLLVSKVVKLRTEMNIYGKDVAYQLHFTLHKSLKAAMKKLKPQMEDLHTVFGA